MVCQHRPPPPGYLICDGALISRSLYSDLFSVIGTTFGSGDGSTTFALPDLRAAFIRGTGSSNGYSGGPLGAMQMATQFGFGAGTIYHKNITTGAWVPTTASAIISSSADNSTQTTTNGAGIPNGGDTSSTYKVPSISARPYNISLTPIIKY